MIGDYKEPDKKPKLEYDKYAVVDGKFVHITTQYYNPYFDGGKDSTGKKRARKDVSKVGFSK